MKSLGICTKRLYADELNYEKRRLHDEALAVYDVVRLIDPAAVTHSFVRGEAKPRVVHRGEDISTLSTLMVRSTGGRESATAVLVRSLRLCGCDVLDPVERFAVGTASKLLTTLTRFQSGAGTSTYLSFSRDGATELLYALGAEGRLPLVLKPASGKKGRGIHLIGDVTSGLRWVDEHFGYMEYADEPFLLQEQIDVKKEYRILLVDGEPLGMVEKVGVPGEAAANAARGARFVRADAPEVAEAVLRSVSGQGMLGVDVAVDRVGGVHVIEANRAPDWEAFERATGLNVARLVIERAVGRLALSD
jgi:glutathione synthase/RimK-type ligase-like ATP-grasp enzyme